MKHFKKKYSNFWKNMLRLNATKITPFQMMMMGSEGASSSNLQRRAKWRDIKYKTIVVSAETKDQDVQIVFEWWVTYQVPCTTHCATSATDAGWKRSGRVQFLKISLVETFLSFITAVMRFPPLCLQLQSKSVVMILIFVYLNTILTTSSAFQPMTNHVESWKMKVE